MERIRTFVALNLPVESLDRVVDLQRRLRDAARAAGVRVAWVPPPNLHVTLKFLGEVPAESAYALRDCLRQRLDGRPAWPLTLREVGVFPQEQSPRVVWVGLEDTGQTAELARAVDEALVDLGFAKEERPFHPHLTLGRIKEGSAPFWRDSADFATQPCTPLEVVLYRSLLERRGAEYTALERYPLRTPKKRTTNATEEIAGHGSQFDNS